jgi:hypothetical protein
MKLLLLLILVMSQECSLGPLFFNVFINDLSAKIIFRTLLFTDDLKIFRVITLLETVNYKNPISIQHKSGTLKIT